MIIRDEFQTLFDRMAQAYRKRDAAACARMWTENGVIYSPFGPPLSGRSAIEAAHRNWTADGAGTDKDLRVLDVGAEGGLAWCLVRYSEEAERGFSLNILERQADGTWLIRLTSLNDDVADPG